jgi:hypothetical protein
MVLLGIVLLVRSRLRRLGRLEPRPGINEGRGIPDRPPSWTQRTAFALVLLFCLAIPSNWTQDVPARYGKRHSGLEHSWLYPEIDTRPPR